jgi:hypothetical protein
MWRELLLKEGIEKVLKVFSPEEILSHVSSEEHLREFSDEELRDLQEKISRKLKQKE